MALRTLAKVGQWAQGTRTGDLAEMPGLDEKDFEITVSRDLLTIKGEKKIEHEQKNGNGYHRERSYGAFSRSLLLNF